MVPTLYSIIAQDCLLSRADINKLVLLLSSPYLVDFHGECVSH